MNAWRLMMYLALSIAITCLAVCPTAKACVVRDLSKFKLTHWLSSPVADGMGGSSWAWVKAYASKCENGVWVDDIYPNKGWNRKGWYEDISSIQVEWPQVSHFIANASGARATLEASHRMDNITYYDYLTAGSWENFIEGLLTWLLSLF